MRVLIEMSCWSIRPEVVGPKDPDGIPAGVCHRTSYALLHFDLVTRHKTSYLFCCPERFEVSFPATVWICLFPAQNALKSTCAFPRPLLDQHNTQDIAWCNSEAKDFDHDNVRYACRRMLPWNSFHYRNQHQHHHSEQEKTMKLVMRVIRYNMLQSSLVKPKFESLALAILCLNPAFPANTLFLEATLTMLHRWNLRWNSSGRYLIGWASDVFYTNIT